MDMPIDVVRGLRLVLRVTNLPDILFELLEDAADEIEDLREECAALETEVATLVLQTSVLQIRLNAVLAACPEQAAAADALAQQAWPANAADRPRARGARR